MAFKIGNKNSNGIEHTGNRVKIYIRSIYLMFGCFGNAAAISVLFDFDGSLEPAISCITVKASGTSSTVVKTYQG